MRKIILPFLVSAFVMMSCEKTKLASDVSNYTIGSYLKLVEAENLLLDASAPAASTVSVIAKPIGSALEKINIYVVAGGPDGDKTKWKPVKSVPVTDTVVTLGVNGTELAAALGIPITDIEPGSQFTFYNETVTTDGRKYDVTNTEDDLEGQPAFQSVFNWTATVVCPFTNNFSGDYTIVLDEWDGNNGGDVTVVPGPGANEITLKTPFPFSANAKDVVISIDPVTGAATVAKQVYGDYPGFPDLSVTTSGANNFVFSCTETIDLLFNHTSPAGNFGNFRLVISK
jgi:hypothetical protein